MFIAIHPGLTHLGDSPPGAGEEEENWLPRVSVGFQWQKGKGGLEEMGEEAGGAGLVGIPSSSS